MHRLSAARRPSKIAIDRVSCLSNAMHGLPCATILTPGESNEPRGVALQNEPYGLAVIEATTSRLVELRQAVTLLPAAVADGLRPWSRHRCALRRHRD